MRITIEVDPDDGLIPAINLSLSSELPTTVEVEFIASALVDLAIVPPVTVMNVDFVIPVEDV
jgi:hypothetical protein